ncbi:glutamic-type intramembrane protease PrsW [Bacillus spongiae]|uniref:Protease PrsW n=1 Tax=Bacillus spongiae TaxID=2683610 RepID=A0ABU8HDA0_9BACI
MLVILSAGIAPGLAFLSYIYLKDQYSQEPIQSVFRTFMYGALLTFPIMFIQHILRAEGIVSSPLGEAFFSAALLEEFFKWFVLFFIVVQSVKFDDPYDGIVYGASVSLGFASVENILYLFNYGVSYAFGRALLPVSSHALLGVIMGYYIGKNLHSTPSRKIWVIFSLFIPIILHGTYDFILVSNFLEWEYMMVPFMLFLWWLGMRKVKIAHLLTNKKEQYPVKKDSSFYQ